MGLGVGTTGEGCGEPSPHEPGGLDNIKNSEFVQILNSLGILSTKSTISQKLKIAELSQKYMNPFQNIAHLLERKKVVIFKTILRILTITQKIKIGTLIFHSYQHIAHLLCKYGHF